MLETKGVFTGGDNVEVPTSVFTGGDNVPKSIVLEATSVITRFVYATGSCYLVGSGSCLKGPSIFSFNCSSVNLSRTDFVFGKI